MTWRKIFRRGLIAFLSVIFLLSAAIIGAAVQIFDGKGQYIMSDFEKHDTAKQRSQQRAENDAQKKAGVALKTFSRTINSELADEEVSAVTNNIIKVSDVKIVPVTFEADGESGLMYKANLKATIDVEGIYEWLKRDDKEKITIIQQNKDLQDAMTKNDEQAEALKARYKRAKSQDEKDKIRKQMNDGNREFLANQKLKKGDKLAHKGDYNGAIELYYEALELNPNFAGAYNNLGIIFKMLGQNELAVQNYDKAIEFKPDYAFAYNNRANAYFDLKKHDLAIKDYNKSIALNPNFEGAYYNRGNAYKDLGQYERAIQDYDKAIALKPNFVQAYGNRGLAYKNLGQYSGAIQDYSKAIELKPNKSNYYNNRGNAYALLGNFKQALVDFNKYIQLEPNDPDGYQKRGICYQQLGEEAKAQADFAKAKQLGYKE